MERTPPDPRSVEERLERLERSVAGISARLDALARSRETAAPDPDPAVSHEALRTRAGRWALQGEQWTGRAGLALLFLGLVFLFQYSIEQGWITPLVRVLFGLAVGGGLLGAGLRLEARRPSYSAILLAGSVAAFYVTGWAAFQLYALVGRPLALIWMAAVTLLALVLARRQAQPAFASLGAIGGFATPFLLGTGRSEVSELVVYAALVVSWTATLYFTRGWRSVLWTYAAGGLAVLAVAGQQADGTAERWATQLALVLTWALGIGLPFAREARRVGSDDPHPDARLPFALELRLLGVGGTSAALWIMDRMWSIPDRRTGVLFLLVAALYGAFAWIGTRRPNFVARSAAPVAAALCATGTLLLLQKGALLWLVVGIEAFLFVVGGSRPRFRGLEWAGHGLFLLLAFALVRDARSGGAAAFDALAWAHLGGVALAAVAAGYVRPERLAWSYRIAAHLLMLVWLADEFGDLAGGTGWITLAWGTYGGILLLGALEWGRRRAAATHAVQLVAASALALTVLKLLVVDLSEVSALVRVLLFLGFGAALLVLSSQFQRPGHPPGLHEGEDLPIG